MRVCGQFITRGATKFKELCFHCKILWLDCNSEIMLAINIPLLDIFTFELGGLWSKLVPLVKIVHSFHKPDGGVVLVDNQRAANIGKFSACMVSKFQVHRKGIVMKFVILLFPASAEELNDTLESQLPGWLGVKA